MIKTRLLAAACLLWAASAHAQTAPTECPTLPADSGLGWERLDNPGFTFCKAIRQDASQAFAVMITDDSPFKPKRGDRMEETVIDGRETHWYRSELAARPDLLVRETLIELDRDHVAHISLRAASQEELARSLQIVESLRFGATRLSSN
jgi:hypothetical protein